MKQERQRRTRWVNTRFSDTEYAQLQKRFAQTTCRELSDYIRRTLLAQPVSITYRNQSLDDFLTDMVALTKELNTIGSYFNQTVHQLNQIQQHTDLQHWLMVNQQDKTILFRQIETISNRIHQLHQLWSHE